MAKMGPGKSGGTSRIRFVMVDAEIADGDMGQITQAIQNALRGPAPPVQRIAAPAPAKTITQEPTQEFAREAEVELDEGANDAATPVPKPTISRKAAPTPKALDLDLNTEPSLASYAAKASAKSHSKRFLLIAAWFKEHRGVAAITPDHAYTCYRSLKWPTNLPDFAQPLRTLKFKQLFTKKEKGSYEINHLGLAEVSKILEGAG